METFGYALLLLVAVLAFTTFLSWWQGQEKRDTVFLGSLTTIGLVISLITFFKE